VLGAKVSGDAYTKEDLELLNTLSKQAGIAIENARLYRQVQEFGQKLKAEVDKATYDLKEANTHLQSLIKVKDEFLQIASHQLRTPVSVMRGMLDMLREGGNTLTPEQRAEMIERAAQKSEKLNQVIDDVLSATEMDVPKFDISGTARSVDLKELAQRAVDSHQDEAADKGVRLIFEAGGKVPKVNASDTYLPQAMTNLIDNAIKYTKDGSVTVKVYQEEKMVVFAVQDTGIGVPEEDLQKLWTKFKRGGNAKNMHTDGSGLGLFIIKKIVEGHPGGKVFVESKLGSGSTFGFKLPMIKEQ
jgi:signal transduction histidine kinase